MRQGHGTDRKFQMTRLIRTDRPNGRAQTRAFTAIELLVVLGVVILLVALVVVAVGGSKGGAREARTRLTFQTLLACNALPGTCAMIRPLGPRVEIDNQGHLSTLDVIQER